MIISNRSGAQGSFGHIYERFVEICRDLLRSVEISGGFMYFVYVFCRRFRAGPVGSLPESIHIMGGEQNPPHLCYAFCEGVS